MIINDFLEKSNFLIGTFYTEGTLYADVVFDYLVWSCENLGLQSLLTIKHIKNYGSWIKNVAEKPRIILELLNGTDKDLLFLDADSTIEKLPLLFLNSSFKCDIAYHVLDWNSWYGYNNNPSTKELLTGTMYFRNCDKVKELCKKWYFEALKTTEWEQKVLQKIISNFNLDTYILPLEYCYIKNRPNGLEPLVKLEPVILHHQVSRTLKKSIK